MIMWLIIAALFVSIEGQSLLVKDPLNTWREHLADWAQGGWSDNWWASARRGSLWALIGWSLITGIQGAW